MKSNYVGVFYREDTGKFRAYIKATEKIEYLGNFINEIDAAKKYDAEVISRDLNRKLNFPVLPINLIPNTRLIQLNRKEWAIVDEEDYGWLSLFNWCIDDYNKNIPYAATRIILDGISVKKRMHSLIIEKYFGKYRSVIDHKNGNGLHNYKSNLRICSNKENLRNRTKRDLSTKSIYKGVTTFNTWNKFSSSISVDGKRIYLGRFIDETDAAMAYDTAARKYFGEFARLNFPEL